MKSIVRMMKLKRPVALMAAMLAVAGMARAAEISAIRAFYCGGQTFVQWEESADPAWTTFNVYRSAKPIASVKDAGVACLARELIPRSGRDFFALKRAGYSRHVAGILGGLHGVKYDGDPALTNIAGMPLPGGRGASSPTGGLFVHTVREAGKAYYAVTCSDSNGVERAAVALGASSMREPVEELVQAPEPYLVGGADVVFPEGKRSTLLYFQAISGTSDLTFAGTLGGNVKSYLFWMPREFGWREGLPTMIHVRYKPADDRYEVWPDDSNFAFMGFGNCWWYGYNDQILHPEKLPVGTVQDYGHRKLDFLVEWAFRMHPGLDREHFIATGPSMGGTGALCYAIRRPKLFTLIEPWVPAVDVVKLDGANPSMRMLFGPLNQPVKAWNGKIIWDEICNTRYVSETKTDLPFIRVVHMRNDTWMTWSNNIPFYEALDRNRHGWMAWWGPAGHNGCDPFCPKLWDTHPVRQLPLSSSFLAISRCSANERWGNGGLRDGDLYGGANLYVNFEVVRDMPEAYEARFSLNRPDSSVTMDITPRRLQAFRLKPGDTVSYALTGGVKQSGKATADAEGVLTIKGVGPFGPGLITLVLTR